MRSLTPRASVTTWCKIRRSGMVCAAVFGKLWRHKHSQSLLSGCDTSREKEVFDVYPTSAQGSRSTGANGTFLSGDRTKAI